LRLAGIRDCTVLVGLSGGPDSVALLDALVAVADERAIRVHAAHLDHRLRPEAAQDAAFCARLCAQLGVPLHTASADVAARAARDRRGLEAAARRERYAFLRGTAAECGARFVLVGHNQDDQAETLLLRLLRGAGTRGLGAMRPRRGMVVRPLLGVSRTQILAHLQMRGQDFVLDPSNADAAFTRNRVRHEVLPVLALLNPRIAASLARTARLLARDERALQGLARAAAGQWQRSAAGGIAIPVALLRSLPPAIATRVLLAGLRRTGGRRNVGALHVEALLRLGRSRSGNGRRLELPGGRQAGLDHGHLTLGSASIRAKSEADE
jgi:tRNA(Ile)-lysidine synthase